MAKSTYKELEQSGWRRKANAYDEWFATITRQAIEPTLDALGDHFAGTKLLDICTGTGHLAGAAAKRGALAEGLDFADTMVAKAQANYPNLRFTVGDAENLPYKTCLTTMRRSIKWFADLVIYILVMPIKAQELLSIATTTVG